jgi:hypothetical protein
MSAKKFCYQGSLSFRCMNDWRRARQVRINAGTVIATQTKKGVLLREDPADIYTTRSARAKNKSKIEQVNINT